MLDQLFNIVKNFGQDAVVNNPDVPNEHNEHVMADATSTVAGGLRNIVAGGGFQSILDLFKGAGSGSGGGSSIASNPIVSMMTGHFIDKLISKYNLSPSAASSVAGKLIPQTVQHLAQQTADPANQQFTLDGLIGSLTGGGASSGGSSSLQDLLNQFTGGAGSGGNTGGSGGMDLQNLIGDLSKKAQNSFQGGEQGGGGGFMDLIKGFISR